MSGHDEIERIMNDDKPLKVQIQQPELTDWQKIIIAASMIISILSLLAIILM